MKRIVVDARTIVDTVDGIGFYSIYFIKRLVHHFAGRCHIYVILPMRRTDISIFTPAEREHLRLAFCPQEAFGTNHQFDYRAWDEFIAALRPDVYISTSYFPTAYDCRRVVIIHDLIPVLFPNEFAGREVGRKEMFERILQEAALTCDLLIGVSEHTAKDIRQHYPQRRGSVAILHPDVEYTIRRIQQQRSEPVQQHGRFLMIGVNRPRKNVELVIAALKRLREQGETRCKVYFIGGLDEGLVPLPRYIAENKLEDVAESLGYVSDEEMAQLINGSIGLLYPSQYEGFGMPLIEFMIARKPIICQRLSSLPEVGGDIPLYCANDPQELAEQMLAVVTGACPPRPAGEIQTQLKRLVQCNRRQYAALFTRIESWLQPTPTPLAIPEEPLLVPAGKSKIGRRPGLTVSRKVTPGG